MTILRNESKVILQDLMTPAERRICFLKPGERGYLVAGTQDGVIPVKVIRYEGMRASGVTQMVFEADDGSQRTAFLYWNEAFEYPHQLTRTHAEAVEELRLQYFRATNHLPFSINQRNNHGR